MTRNVGLSLAVIVWTAVARGNMIANPDMEKGKGNVPADWTLEGTGTWGKTEEGRLLSMTGTGADSGRWLSRGFPVKPLHCYRLSFDARGVNASGYLVSGSTSVNNDIPIKNDCWNRESFVFCTPLRTEEEKIHLGQWHLSGTVLFDNVSLVPVEPVHSWTDGMELGVGEKVEGNRYTFQTAFEQDSKNYSRPLAWARSSFNSTRWCMGQGDVVVYRQALKGRRFTAAKVAVGCGYYVSGSLAVEASTDSKTWTSLGMLTRLENVHFAVPTNLCPAETLLIRLRGAKGCSLQVYRYAFDATVDGPAVKKIATGDTRFLHPLVENPRLRVKVKSLGTCVPGGDNVASLHLVNSLGGATNLTSRVVFTRNDSAVCVTNEVPLELPSGGAFDVTVPYVIPGVGDWTMTLSVADLFRADTFLQVPSFYEDGYGELLPANVRQFNLWRASSGWKIPRFRTLPRTVAKSLVVRLARNEAEAVQLVLAPNQPLQNVRVTVGDLLCGNAKIPSSNISVRVVGYVSVTQPTDKTGVIADWADPLIPHNAPLSVRAGENQPFWICVKAQKNLPAGIYRGRVKVAAGDVVTEVGLNAEVYDFDLPDKMTCETSFGFGLNRPFQYQKPRTEAERRQIAESYLSALSDHHISPYNPAPLTQWKVEWKGMPKWRGGSIVQDKEKGSCVKIVDADTKNNESFFYRNSVSLPAKGMKVAFDYRTETSQPVIFSVSHLRKDGKWMSGCNRDMRLEASTAWRHFESVYAEYPKEADRGNLTFYAAGFQENGSATGTLWLCNLRVTDAETGKALTEDPMRTALAVSAEPVFDWTEWDAEMERAFAKWHFNTFVIRVEGIGGGDYNGAGAKPSFLGYPDNTPEYEALWGKYVKGIESHLREKGWLDKAYVYWYDEPGQDAYDYVMAGMAKLKKHAPGLRRFLTEQIEKELIGGPNLWCPLTPSLEREELEERRKAGDHFWWYVCCVPQAPYVTEFIDHPGTEMRLWLWQTWQHRVEGILIWETLWWSSNQAYPDFPQNPYLDPMSWVADGKLAPGTRNPWGNGDGRFLYPPVAAADGMQKETVLDAPVPSYRLELLRDGIEDYEYFVMLKRLLAGKRERLTPREAANIEALLTVPVDVSKSLTSFTHDPAPMEAHREKLAQAIVRLLQMR